MQGGLFATIDGVGRDGAGCMQSSGNREAFQAQRISGATRFRCNAGSCCKQVHTGRGGQWLEEGPAGKFVGSCAEAVEHKQALRHVEVLREEVADGGAGRGLRRGGEDGCEASEAAAVRVQRVGRGGLLGGPLGRGAEDERAEELWRRLGHFCRRGCAAGEVM